MLHRCRALVSLGVETSPRDPLGAIRSLASLMLRLQGAVAAARVLGNGTIRAEGAIVLAYHDITELSTTTYQVSTSLFRSQLRWAQQAGVNFVPLSEVVDRLINGCSVDGLGAVAFDDGLVGVRRRALPVLQELAIPATVFVVAGRIGQATEWWPGADRMMNETELGDLVACGVDVGSHSLIHASLPTLSLPRLVEEVRDSRSRLEDLMQRPVDLFAYPFGDVDLRVRATVETAGYRGGFTFLNGRVVNGLDRLLLPRLNMRSGQRRWRLAYHLARSASSWGDTAPGSVRACGSGASALGTPGRDE